MARTTTNKQQQQSQPSQPAADTTTTAALVQAYLRSAKYRRPSTMVPHIAARGTSNSNSSSLNYLPTIRPPYNNSALDRFEDAFRSDRLLQNAVVKRTQLVVGRHGKIVMDTTEEFDNADDRTAALQKIQNNTEYQDARKQIQKLHTKPAINFHPKLEAAVIQSKVYGRAAIEEAGRDDDGLPQALHVLNSKRLGKPEIDSKTWEFLGVHYLDLSKGSTGMDDVLDAESLIYFANRDYHISPGSLYYGLSDLEGVIDGSDSKRIAKQEDIKEIMKSNWAPFLILKFTNPNITVAQMQEVINGMAPGLPFAHKQDIQSEKIDLQANLQQITEACDFLNRETLRELGVPAFIAGYEQIANYANSQQVLLAYKEIELEADRTGIKDIIQQQWLNKLFYHLLNIDLEAGDEPEVKLSYEFEDVSFETNLDKINSSLLLFDRQLISGEKVLKIADYQDEIEEYKLRKEEQDRLKQERMQAFIQQQQQRQQQNGSKNGEGQDNGQAQPTITPADQQVSTTNRKRQGSNIDLVAKFAETLDAIAEDVK